LSILIKLRMVTTGVQSNLKLIPDQKLEKIQLFSMTKMNLEL